MDLPQPLGSRVVISAHDYRLKLAVEAHGFWPERGTPRYFVMRRDAPDEMIVTK